jgi:glycine oxidase
VGDRLSTEVVVVGAGVLGKSIAFELARAGVEVLCVGTEHSHPGTASAAAGAMLGVLGEVVDDKPTSQGLAELECRRQAAEMYPAFLEALVDAGAERVSLGRGTFIIANLVNRADRSNLRAIRAAAARLRLGCETVDPQDVPGLKPGRGYEAVEVMFVPQEASIESGRLLVALEEALEGLYASRRMVAEVVSLSLEGDRIGGVELSDSSRICARTVVLANGVGIQPLLQTAGDCLPCAPRLLGGKGVSAIVYSDSLSIPHVIRTPNRDFACGTHAVPHGRAHLYIGATNRIDSPPGAAGVTPGELHALMHSAIHEINLGIRTMEIAHIGYGMRPLTTDHIPLVGGLDCDGLFIATGTYRNGVLLAPLIAASLAAEIRGDAGAPLVFDPRARAGFEHPDVVALLERGLRDVLSFSLEPGGRMPYDREAELASLLSWFGRTALEDSEEARTARLELAGTLSAAPIGETVSQLYYDIAAGNRRWPARGS